MVKASPLRRVYFLPSGRLRVEARYDIERCPLAQLLAEGHGLEEDEVGAGARSGGRPGWRMPGQHGDSMGGSRMGAA
jgi:hypothetical protein